MSYGFDVEMFLVVSAKVIMDCGVGVDCIAVAQLRQLRR